MIRAALQDAAVLDYNMKTGNGQMLALAATYGFRPNFDAFRQRARLTWKSGRFTPSICAAMDSAPAVANANSVVPLPQ